MAEQKDMTKSIESDCPGATLNDPLESLLLPIYKI